MRKAYIITPFSQRGTELERDQWLAQGATQWLWQSSELNPIPSLIPQLQPHPSAGISTLSSFHLKREQKSCLNGDCQGTMIKRPSSRLLRALLRSASNPVFARFLQASTCEFVQSVLVPLADLTPDYF